MLLKDIKEFSVMLGVTFKLKIAILCSKNYIWGTRKISVFLLVDANSCGSSVFRPLWQVQKQKTQGSSHLLNTDRHTWNPSKHTMK